jgi:3-hydroxyacyl-[acyl-carrier-protein] dehydratase
MNGCSLRLRFGADHPALAGHFPQRPIVPGVLLLDEALHAIEQASLDESPQPPGTHWYLASVKFHRIVQAGEALRLECAQQAGDSVRVEIHAAQALVMSAAIERRRP